MVEWLGLRGGEDALEPSGGHGAIARWLPDSVQRTVIEPSPALRSRLAMVMDLGNDRIIDGTFEELANVNKFDGIAMNPPFGVGGSELHRRAGQAGRPGQRDRPADRQTARGEEGVCPAAQTLGGRAQFRVAVALSTVQS